MSAEDLAGTHAGPVIVASVSVSLRDPCLVASAGRVLLVGPAVLGLNLWTPFCSDVLVHSFGDPH